jgi:glyoxylase-like metal-dependent hydrolase (beta-lactamase superfamily II)
LRARKRPKPEQFNNSFTAAMTAGTVYNDPAKFNIGGCMAKKHTAVFALLTLLFVFARTTQAQDAKTVLANAAKAMGAENLKSIQYSGSGSNAGIGQNKNANAAWPLVRMKSYIREIDLNAPSSRVQMVRVQNGPPAQPDQMQTQIVVPGAPWDSQFNLWLSPYTFLKAAMASNDAAVKLETIDGDKYNVVTFALQNKYKIAGYINGNNLVERVRTWVNNDVLGDMLVEGVYEDYKDFSGVKFPTTIIEKQGGFPVVILVVSDVKPNAAVNIPAQQTQTQPGAEPTQTVAVQSEKVADGVFYLRGGTHHSVALEFADHVVVIEAPQNEQRSLAVIAEVKKLIPNKPIRYVVNTHHHFDHSGGLRTYVDQGVTIITNVINKPFYEKAFTSPRTLNPDRLAQSKKMPMIDAVTDKKVLTDGTRTLELHLIKDSPHNDGILMAYLPKERILVEVDVYTPPNPAANAPATAAPPNPNTVNLVENIERLKLDIDTILPLHGPGAATKADLYKAGGKTGTSN